MDINTKKLKKNAFRITKERGITASRVRVPGGHLDAELLGKIQEISEKYGISTGYISMINKGTKWYNDKLNYPLCRKGCSDGAWSEDAKRDLIFTNLTHVEIGKKYNKQKSTITALNTGRNRKDSRLKYPLRQHQEENKQIWVTLF